MFGQSIRNVLTLLLVEVYICALFSNSCITSSMMYPNSPLSCHRILNSRSQLHWICWMLSWRTRLKWRYLEHRISPAGFLQLCVFPFTADKPHLCSLPQITKVTGSKCLLNLCIGFTNSVLESTACLM